MSQIPFRRTVTDTGPHCNHRFALIVTRGCVRLGYHIRPTPLTQSEDSQVELHIRSFHLRPGSCFALSFSFIHIIQPLLVILNPVVCCRLDIVTQSSTSAAPRYVVALLSRCAAFCCRSAIAIAASYCRTSGKSTGWTDYTAEEEVASATNGGRMGCLGQGTSRRARGQIWQLEAC